MAKFFVALRAALYATGFVLLWAWAASAARQLDADLGGSLPEWVRIPGVALMAVGATLDAACLAFFVARGSGTPAPFDAPRRFVASGPYRFVRNPMYLGGFLLLAGWGLWSRSGSILLLSALGLLLAHVFVVLVEEPGLERRFGESYRAYRRSVRRWRPRIPKRAS